MTSNITNLGASTPSQECGKSLRIPWSGRLSARCARLQPPLTSNYKGFPLCQANETHRAAQRLDSHLTWLVLSTTAPPCCCASHRSVEQGCGRTNYNRSFVQLLNAADPDEGRARGPHSLAADSLRCRLELIRHTPRRSKPLLINAGASRGGVKRVRSSCWSAVLAVGYTASLNCSPRDSIAQHSLAFLAAMATTAFQ